MAKKIEKPVKSYENLKFLHSSDARIVRILSEFVYPQAKFKEKKVYDTIVFFGSARIKSKKEAIKEFNQIKNSDPKKTQNFADKLRKAQQSMIMSKYYEDAVDLSKKLTIWSMNLSKEEKRFIICTGGGPGIMEAANKGAKLAGGTSIGLNISIPFEQFVNKWVTNELSFEFHYFFMRKYWFTYLAKTLIVFPGGFGTLDEFMEILTLLQTEKVKKKMLIVAYDEKFWKNVVNFDKLVEYGTISKEDIKLITFCSTVDEAFQVITKHLEKNYGNKQTSQEKELII